MNLMNPASSDKFETAQQRRNFITARDHLIQQEYLAGKRLDEIAAAWTVTSERIRQILVRDKIPIRPVPTELRRPNRMLTTAEKRVIRNYVEANPGMHYQKVAVNLDHTYYAVKKAMIQPKKSTAKLDNSPAVSTKSTKDITSKRLGRLVQRLRDCGWTTERIQQVLN